MPASAPLRIRSSSAGQRLLGGLQQILALAAALGLQARVQAQHQPLAGEIRAGEFGNRIGQQAVGGQRAGPSLHVGGADVVQDQGGLVQLAVGEAGLDPALAGQQPVGPTAIFAVRNLRLVRVRFQSQNFASLDQQAWDLILESLRRHILLWMDLTLPPGP